MTLQDAKITAATTEGPDGPAPVLFLCEHASNFIPPEFGGLGLPPELRDSHIAWDPGALPLARRMALAFRAPLVAGAVSRLVYDCNRPPEAPDSVPERSEVHDIPGNRGLSGANRAQRAETVYRPFVAAVESALAAAGPAALVTVHSFTPVYAGKPRDVEIGILHDSDSRLADALLDALPRAPRAIRRNEPYGPADGVTHSLKKYALPRGLLNVMLEIRNDLLEDEPGQAAIADLLIPALQQALADCGAPVGGAS